MKKIKLFINFVKENDRSIHSTFEVLLLPGIHAIFLHRIANFVYRKRMYLLARVINTISKFFTGVDIHPGAIIGSPVFIDHATGVVIGEQAIVGNRVVIYHGVTLGAKNQSDEIKRHPTIGNDVVIGCNSIILGNITIQDNAKVRAGSLITKSI